LLQQVNERLAKAATQMAQYEKLQRRVTELEREQRPLSATVEELGQQVRKEEHDVERLEGVSISGLFHSILGSREEQMHKERQEALAARLKYDEAVRRLEALQRELQQAHYDVQAAAGAEIEYRRAMQEKEAYVTNSGAQELFQLGEREQQLSWKRQQLQEAVSAGQTADSWLQQVEGSLGTAKGWGTWDLLGGGLIATMAKHSNMDDAKNAAHHASQALAYFRRELKDVEMVINVESINLDGFTRFADYFFDGLIVDWVVQSRINESLESVRSARYQVSGLLQYLRQQLQQAETDLAALTEERVAFIERYGM